MVLKNEYSLTIDSTTEDSDVVDLLCVASGLSRRQVKEAMTKGAVSLQSVKRRRLIRRQPSQLLCGQRLHMFYDPAVLSQKPVMPQLIADKSDFSVWVKPRGLWSQGSRWGDHCSIARVVEQQLQRSCFVVHRLDKSACGLILLAHNKAAAASLSALFREHEIEKSYAIVVCGDFPAQAQRISMPIDEKPACSTFSRVRALGDKYTLVSVSIESGRKHQVRRHAAHLGFPVLGDRLYGKSSELSVDLQLCAKELRFVWHKDKEVCHYLIDAHDYLYIENE